MFHALYYVLKIKRILSSSDFKEVILYKNNTETDNSNAI